MGDRLSVPPIRQFIRFLGVGILNTIFGYGVFAALIWIGTPAPTALFLSTVLGVLFNFLTTGRLVFNNRDHRLLGRFVAAYGIVYIVNLILLDFIRARGINAIPAQGICLLLAVPLSFAIQKTFVFRT